MGGKNNFKQAFKELTGTINLNSTIEREPYPAADKERDETSFSYTRPMQPVQAPGPGITKISKGTSIVGEITSDGDVELYGCLKGNIETSGNIKVFGEVLGNLKGNDIELSKSNIRGNVESSANVTMDEETKIIGDITAVNLTMDGKMKGQIEAGNKVELHKNTLLLGNIKAEVISVEDGAKLQGEIHISNTEKENIFNDK
ncbi:MAG: polymer-forming cytoskeletal protein [Bacillota bacterium]|nr:polymer-forming cytoskeletal protein [Bacillota bacterium]